ncbi:autotransporter domain-containing protein [Tianweitania populi]|uniref:Autotransporter domain-containing protein n=1 Tax=Tianweitania populi TaxID=1607949 RepID=A0A8J3DPP6_9HYPH|nr:autotransporter domain-containing protein [Tianweitania populi]GHD15136.1 hypothetical protein GCM10016234_21490 [Tianweitania populi]
MANTRARGRTLVALKATTAGAMLLAFGAGALAQEAPKGDTIRLLNLNIWNKFEKDPTPMAGFIVDGNYDAIMFQEAKDSYMTRIPEILRDAGRGTYLGRRDGSAAILTRLPGTIDHFQAQGFDSQGKNVPFATIDASGSRPQTTIGSIHMDYSDGSAKRLLEAKALNAWAKQVAAPLIVSGDFNAGDVSERGLHRVVQQLRTMKSADGNSLYASLSNQYLDAGNRAQSLRVIQDAFPGQDINKLTWKQWANALEGAYNQGKDIGLTPETYPVASNTPVTMNVLKKQFMLLQTDSQREPFSPHTLNDGSVTWPSKGEDATGSVWPSWDRVKIDHFLASRPFGKWYVIADDPADKSLGTLRDLYSNEDPARPVSDHDAVAHEFRWIGPKLETYASGATAKTRLVWGEGAYDFNGRNKEFFLTRNNMRKDVYLGQIADENGNPILADLTLDEKKTLLDCAGTDARFAKAVQDYCIDDHSFIGETLVTDGGTLIVDEDAALGGVDADLRLANGRLRVVGTTMTSLDREVKLDAAGIIDVADAGNDVSVSQAISGQGSLTKRGAGALTLDAANSYLGGTMVEAGTLRAGVAGALSNSMHYAVNGGQLDLNGFDLTAASLSGLGGTVALGDASLTLDQSINTRFDGSIEGAGSLTKSGAGWLTLNGVNTYTGGTTVQNGGLIVGDANHAGASIVGNVAVSNGAILAGSGTLGGLTVASGASVAPGNSIGTLNVAGDLTLQAGSTYQVEIDPSGAGDRISAAGFAQIDGANVFVQKAPGTYTPGRSYEILTAAGGVDGRFAALNQNLPFIDLGFTYDPTRVTLDVQRNDVAFPTVGETANQRAVATAVEALGGGNSLYDAVVWQDGEEAARASFDALSGEIHASTKTALINDSASLRNAANERIRAAFAGSGSVDMPVMSYADGAQAVQPAGPSGPALWTQAFGVWSTTKSTSETAELEQSTGGFFTGFDGALSETWRLGLMAGYSRSSFDVDALRSSADSDNYHLGVYGGGEWNKTAFRAGIGYSWHSVETSRSVAFPGFSDRLLGDYDAGTFQAFGELSHRFDVGQAALEPFANLAYVSLNTDGFSERGGAAALSIGEDSMDTTLTTLGLRASAPFNLGSVVAQARGLIGWQHAYGDTTPNTNVAFAGGGAFDVTGAAVAEDTALVEAGIDFTLSENATLGVQYGGQFGSDFTQNAVKARFSLNF